MQPPPSAGTFVHAVTGQVVSESVSAFLALIIGPWSQEVVVAVVVVVVVVVVGGGGVVVVVVVVAF